MSEHDPRFSRIKNDPRFRRPKKIRSKVVVDDRFKGIFQEHEKKVERKAAHVDKYGRKILPHGERDNLRRFYRLETQDDPEPVIDYARGDVLLESSSSEGDSDSESDTVDIVTLGRDISKPTHPPEDEHDAEIDLDEDQFAYLDAQAAAYNRDRPEDEGTSEGPRTRRIAAVNLDWDHVRATHLYKIFSSVVSPVAPSIASGRAIKNTESAVSGRVLSVAVYPSQLGKERLEREAREGPPAEVFKKGEIDDEVVNERTIYEVGDEDEYNTDALRKYQLERLRYYYAIVTCDTVEAAAQIYSELQGTELERSANVFDLSFVPDDMTFDQDCRDEASEDRVTNYKRLDFVTDALRHSKVKLTWDEDDPERYQATRRPFSKKELEEADLTAYIASSSSASESGLDQPPTNRPNRKERKQASRDKLRALLSSGGDDEMPEGWGNDAEDTKDVDMEITFTPGLSGSKGEDEDETTLDKYQRKMREKRKKRKAKEVGTVDKGALATLDDDFFDAASGNEDSSGDVPARPPKGTRKQTRIAVPSMEASRSETTAEELALLVASDNPGAEPKHFNLKSVLKAEKNTKRRKGKRKDSEEDHEQQKDFRINVRDERFKALHEDHTFAIDPTNPHFKKTKSMAALLQERARWQNDQSPNRTATPVKQTSGAAGDRTLESLVESVKRKSAVADQATGKRRKV